MEMTVADVTVARAALVVSDSPAVASASAFAGLTVEQRRVADGILSWHAIGTTPYCTLHGVAGVGKTTVITRLGQILPGARFAAFTGKAASVLRSKGGDGASTLHRLLYRSPDEDEEGDLCWEPRHSIDADLVIADEASMLSRMLGEDLLSFGVKVVFTLDPFQLPPIDPNSYLVGVPADFELTEIHRQAENSQPLRLATAIRRGEPVFPIPFDPDRMLAADIVICAMHRTRRKVNEMWRRANGVPYTALEDHLPWEGDRVLCFKNNRSSGVLNGTLWVCESVEPEGDNLHLRLVDDLGDKAWVDVPTSDFLIGPPKQQRRDQSDCFDFGYAITAHKSQGSEWPTVCVLDETGSPGFRRMVESSGLSFAEYKARFLYTCVTRACLHVDVMMPP
jgi:exodeoxyribonuclease-5